jgi:hypothetical protein
MKIISFIRKECLQKNQFFYMQHPLILVKDEIERERRKNINARIIDNAILEIGKLKTNQGISMIDNRS